MLYNANLHPIIKILLISMTESIGYFSLAIQTINLLQKELIRQFQKGIKFTTQGANSSIFQFKKSFDRHLIKIKSIQLQKSIDQETISQALSEMQGFLQKQMRYKNTSNSERYHYQQKLAINEIHKMRFTGNSFYQQSNNTVKNKDLSDIDEIIRSYKISSQPLKSETRMRWRSPVHQNPQNMQQSVKKTDLMNNSSIEMLKQTIPEMQKRIKQLSFNYSSPKTSKQLHRTVQTRGYQHRKYIARFL